MEKLHINTNRGMSYASYLDERCYPVIYTIQKIGGIMQRQAISIFYGSASYCKIKMMKKSGQGRVVVAHRMQTREELKDLVNENREWSIFNYFLGINGCLPAIDNVLSSEICEGVPTMDESDKNLLKRLLQEACNETYQLVPTLFS